MSGIMREMGAVVRKWFARVVTPPKRYASAVRAASLSVAETLLELVNSKLVPDINRIKEAHIRRIELETEEKKAAVAIKVAEATEAANRTTQRKTQIALQQLEIEEKEAEVDLKRVEADVQRSDAETRRMEAVAKAKTTLLEAVSRLRQEGGEFLLNKENLEQILRLNPPEADAEKDD